MSGKGTELLLKTTYTRIKRRSPLKGKACKVCMWYAGVLAVVNGFIRTVEDRDIYHYCKRRNIFSFQCLRHKNDS